MPVPNVVPKVILADGAANRFVDQLLAVLNPILRNVAGDLSGPVAAPSVVAWRGLPLDESMATPAVDQVPKWNGRAWVPGTAGTAGAVTSVAGAAPITSSGGATPTIGISGTPAGGVAYATGTTLGYSSAGTAGLALLSGGAGAPSFGALALDTVGTVSGQLPVGFGGTGIASYAIGDLLVASGTTALSKLAIGAAGTFLGSTGSTAVWSTPTASTTGAGVGAYRATSSTPVAVALTDYVVDVTGTGAFVANLPTAGSGAGQAPAGRVFILKNSGGATITVTPASGQTIDSAATFVVQTAFASFTFISTGSGWALL